MFCRCPFLSQEGLAPSKGGKDALYAGRVLHSGRFGTDGSSSTNGGPGKHPAPLSPPFPPPLQDHACVRDEAVHRDTRPELRPTPDKSRSPDCKKTRGHLITITSASLVRALAIFGRRLLHGIRRARVHRRARQCVCACCWLRGDEEGGGVCVLSCTSVVMATRSC